MAAFKYDFTQIPDDMWEKLARNAGVLTDSFNPETREIGAQLGATSGGVNVHCTPSFEDMGSDVDNCPKNTMELKNCTGYDCGLSGSMVSVDADALARFIGAADKTGIKVSPRKRLVSDDYKTLYYIIDYGNGGFIAVELINALSTSGVTIKTTDGNKTTFDFEFTGHTSIKDQDTIPMNFYVDGAAEALDVLTVTSSAGTESGDTAITVTPAKESGNSYKYKVDTAATSVTYGMDVSSWDTWDGSTDITAVSGKVITVVEADSDNKAVKVGSATVVSNGGI